MTGKSLRAYVIRLFSPREDDIYSVKTDRLRSRNGWTLFLELIIYSQLDYTPKPSQVGDSYLPTG